MAWGTSPQALRRRPWLRTLTAVRRIVVIALALVALAPAGVQASTWYRSGDGGELRASCACHDGAGHRDAAPPVSEIRLPACCALIELAAHDGAMRAAPPPAPELAAALIGVAPVALAPRQLASAPRAGAREARGPPRSLDLFVRHCALLL